MANEYDPLRERVGKTVQLIAPHLTPHVGDNDHAVATELMAILAQAGWLRSSADPGDEQAIALSWAANPTQMGQW